MEELVGFLKPLWVLFLAWLITSGTLASVIQFVKVGLRGLATKWNVNWLYLDGAGTFFVQAALAFVAVYFFGLDIFSNAEIAELFPKDILDFVNWAMGALGSGVFFKTVLKSTQPKIGRPAGSAG